ncbi:MAG: hypothetical protein M3O46_05730 [Myxococcota bacterium]|nr:hypothetical protein [Myxococcota bacterium]
MLERIALHQTRLHTPGLGFDGKGVALGAKGLLLLPSIETLVALLAAYTHEHSLEEMIPTLAIHVATPKLGTRDVVVEFAAESSDHMDQLAETARLVGGYTFTGSSRHFVQYRDSVAPFGYDAKELLSTDAALALYHDRFSRTYDLGRRIELRSLLLRLIPRVDPSTKLEPGPRIVVAEQGLGPAVVHYFVRSRVDGEVCVAEWPPQNALDDAPARRWVIRIPDLPVRMRPLLQSTPGIGCFVPSGQGVAVEAGYRHPLELRACPVFNAGGLVLVRGRGDEPWIIDRLPPMGPLSSFAPTEMRTAAREGSVATRVLEADALRVPLQMVRSIAPWRRVTATWVPPDQIPLLRRLAYALPRAAVASCRVATTSHGAFLRFHAGVDAVPLGTYFVEVHPNLYLPAGYELSPAIAPEVLARSLEASASQVFFIGTDARAWAIEERAFIPLETALIDAHPWEPAIAENIVRTLKEAAIELKVSTVGLLPTVGAEARLKADG